MTLRQITSLARGDEIPARAIAALDLRLHVVDRQLFCWEHYATVHTPEAITLEDFLARH